MHHFDFIKQSENYMEDDMAKVAVLGYGTVGSGVVEKLNTNADSILKKAGQSIEDKSVLD